MPDSGGGGRSGPKLGVELRNLESSSRRIMYDSVLICDMEEGPGALPATCIESNHYFFKRLS